MKAKRHQEQCLTLRTAREWQSSTASKHLLLRRMVLITVLSDYIGL